MGGLMLFANLAQPLSMDHRELDAARALLGVSPAKTLDAGHSSGDGTSSDFAVSADTAAASGDESQNMEKWHEEFPFRKRPRSDSAGLDALAALASQEQASIVAAEQQQEGGKSRASFVVASAITSSSDEDEDSFQSMPPPPPRYRRRRSASNPEGMEKWDSMRPSESSGGRRHFVLPASILEVELAEASAAVEKQERRMPAASRSKKSDEVAAAAEDSNRDSEEPEEVDEASLSPEELLRRARSRLLEDLSEGSVSEKGVLSLPHALAKYKEVYNKNGRIGIYTPAERAAIISKFNRKRTRRVWNKKIRYNCRKSLADRRLRVKGRFVKRSEQEQLAKELAEKEAIGQGGATDNQDEDDPAQISPDSTDHEMPDVHDPDAGFAPTDDQPYRRLRRHTIT